VELAPRARASTFAGLFLVTLSTLTYQLLLTRTFSVTMYYHFAFVAISVTMFGMAAGAVAVFLRPAWFVPSRAHAHLAICSAAFAVSIVASYLTHLSIPFVLDGSLVTAYGIALTYAALSVPFVFSGIVVSVALTRFPARVSALYAADLAGAALGCVLVGPVLQMTDAPTAVLATAASAGIGAWLFATAEATGEGAAVAARATPGRGLRYVTGAVAAALTIVAAAHAVAARQNAGWLRLVWVKGQYEPRPLVEKWNSFSRIRVIGDPDKYVKPSGWGLSATLPPDRRARELHLDIDSYAGTELTKFSGNPAEVEHLRYDVTNIVHYLRPSSRVIVVGTGGGRDVLSALAFNQKSVTGVEINEGIVGLVNGRFGDFTGHLDRDPRVRFVNDEARSYIARLHDRADVVQISLIDTWAATASGAFVLTENSLYTVDAWRIFLDHLAPRGILTVSRWYYASRPGEVYRLASLASTTLMQMGVSRPGDHFAIVRARPGGADAPDGIGTMLLSRDPLSASDLDTLEEVAARLQFEIVQSPRHSADETFAALADGSRLAAAIDEYPLNISAPTDDRPFFFHMLRLRDVFDTARWRDQGIVQFNMTAVGVLGILFVTVVVLTVSCIVLPLWLAKPRADLAGAAPHLLFFGAIGLGFMLVEISQVQRLTVFLGHPVYSLSVVLFSLLLSSGAGSLSTARMHPGAAGARSAVVRLALLVLVLMVFGLLTPPAVRSFEASPTPVRILVSVGTLLPLGFFMGMAFPIGMGRALAEAPVLAPWLWAVNGSASVCASVLAVVIALGWGISAAFWSGAICYAGALAALVWGKGRKRRESSTLRTDAQLKLRATYTSRT
jgi:hypothetical protein